MDAEYLDGWQFKVDGAGYEVGGSLIIVNCRDKEYAVF